MISVSRYILYNDDVQVAQFTVHNTVIEEYVPEKPELLPMQIRRTSADGFTAWMRERSVDLSSVQHRDLMNSLYASRDKTTLALKTHMFSLSDTFTCFPENEFTPRLQLCRPEDQNAPLQYCVYSTTTVEAEHEDDHPSRYRTYVYLNLWSDVDPTEMRYLIREAMYAAGFGMVEESDKGYNQPAYDTATRQYTVQWTWLLAEPV